MRTTFCLAVLFLVQYVDAAPAPAPGRAAKEKLEALKKKLPDLLSDWLKEKENTRGMPYHYSPELRVMRRVGPDRAKAAIRFEAFDKNDGARARGYDILLTVFLTYQDGCWTTERFETVSFINGNDSLIRKNFAFLMLAIDEAAERKATEE